MAGSDRSGNPPGEWILYDNDCGFCSRWVHFWQPTLAKCNIAIAALQEPWVIERLGLTGESLLHDIRLLSRENTLVSGADVYLHVTRRIWWSWPFYALFSLPGFNWLLHSGYRWFARNRHAISRTCKLQPPADAPSADASANARTNGKIGHGSRR
jgi:predicted DCC family thiol-disulfide oxidoreductase YuxK